VSQRGFSRKLHQLVKQQIELEKTQLPLQRRERYEVKNWKQLTAATLSKMTPIERSRYMAYEPPSKEIVSKQMESLQRVRTRHLMETNKKPTLSLMNIIEKEENNELIGQLKAAEARQRLRSAQKTYEKERLRELEHLISSQPSAQEAVRLQKFIPPTPVFVNVPNYLTKTQVRINFNVPKFEIGNLK
jgi:ribosome-binding ATPase YchF (GTP1/OBG family)